VLFLRLVALNSSTVEQKLDELGFHTPSLSLIGRGKTPATSILTATLQKQREGLLEAESVQGAVPRFSSFTDLKKSRGLWMRLLRAFSFNSRAPG
jgi:hypothetical protein